MNISILSGRIMFGNVVYATKDYSIRIVDGIVTIRWWLQKVRESTVVNGILHDIFIGCIGADVL